VWKAQGATLANDLMIMLVLAAILVPNTVLASQEERCVEPEQPPCLETPAIKKGDIEACRRQITAHIADADRYVDCVKAAKSALMRRLRETVRQFECYGYSGRKCDLPATAKPRP
jgi:hypothetical protein